MIQETHKYSQNKTKRNALNVLSRLYKPEILPQLLCAKIAATVNKSFELYKYKLILN